MKSIFQFLFSGRRREKKRQYIKILNGFFAVILLFSTGFITVYFFAVQRDYRKSRHLEFDSKAQALSAELDQHYHMMKTLIMGLVMQEDFFASIKNLRNMDPEDSEFHNQYRDMINCFVGYTYFQTDYDMIYLDYRGYYYNSAYFTYYHSFPLLKVPKEEMESYGWMDSLEGMSVGRISEASFGTIQENAFTVIQKIKVPTETAGYLIAEKDLAEDYLFTSMEEERVSFLAFDEKGELLLKSKEMGEVSWTEVQDAFEKQEEIRISGKQFGVALHHSGVTGISMVLFYPVNEIFREILFQVWPFILFTVLLLVFTVMIALRLSIFLSAPLNFLEKQMKNTNYDNLTAPLPELPESASIETANLQKTYSEMRLRLAWAMEEKVKLAKEKEKQKYVLLQYQMNPHFLHNTLNIIGILGSEGGNENVEKACQSLADLLRYALKDPSEGATFEEEFQNIESYLELMKLRYEYKMNYTLHLDENLKTVRIPRLVLQPFVENIFEHAFDREHKVVGILVAAFLTEDMWKIVIEDNGKGIDFEMADGKEQTDKYSIGMRNTFWRMETFFKDQSFGYEVSNGENGGCVIVMTGKL